MSRIEKGVPHICFYVILFFFVPRLKNLNVFGCYIYSSFSVLFKIQLPFNVFFPSVLFFFFFLGLKHCCKYVPVNVLIPYGIMKVKQYCDVELDCNILIFSGVIIKGLDGITVTNWQWESAVKTFD